MTSPLDGRIRVAIETALAEQGGMGGVDVAGLQQQITDLHEHLHEAMTKLGKLEYRLEFLEQGAQVLERVTSDDEKKPAPRATRRKPTGE